ncbi:hypothetical protein [Bradyrhizobium sp. WSM1743]|uniref:hypothetical protein n=1 Tax=Bradyrhizobium sp. WSM1743 TaxID=318996 RepID=UPI0012EBE57C|nr:hypothetical protein [Bradyrhizobium sp. WSM1743]
MGHNANLRFWKAWEDRREPGSDLDTNKRTLIVAGEVEVDTPTLPILEEDTGRSAGSKTLYLSFNFGRFTGAIPGNRSGLKERSNRGNTRGSSC